VKKILEKLAVCFIALTVTISVFAGASLNAVFAEDYPPYNPEGNLFSYGDCATKGDWTYYGKSGYATINMADEAFKLTVDKFSSNRTDITLTHKNVPLQPNKEYKVSFWMKCSENVKFGPTNIYPSNPKLLVRVMKNDTTNVQKGSTYIQFELTDVFEKNTWKKVEGILNTEGFEGEMDIETYWVRFFFGTGVVIKDNGAETREPSSSITIICDNFELREVNSQTPQATIELKADGAEAGTYELTGAQTVNIGQKVTIKAAVKKGTNYVFEKWVDESGATVSYDPIYTFIAESDKTFTAKFKQLPAEYRVEISTVGQGSVDKQTNYYGRGSSLTITATPNEGYEFVCWEVNGEKKTNTGLTYTIDKIESNYKIKAYFKETSKPKVIYKDPSGRVLSVGDEPSGSAVNKPGYIFRGWGPQSGSDIPNYEEKTAIYEPISTGYSVNVQKGSIIKGTSPYTFDELVEVTPNGSSTFSYWTYNGEIVSYNSNYKFYVGGLPSGTGQISIAAEFDKNVQAKPTAVINGVITGNGTVSFVAQCIAPSGFTPVEWGVLMSEGSGDINLGTQGVIRGKARTKTGDTGQFIITKETESGKTWYGKAYFICKDSSGNLIVVYSNPQSGTAQ